MDLRDLFKKKDEAKKLGARWDPSKKVWSIPDNLSTTLLNHWVFEDNIRSEYFYIIKSPALCRQCEKIINIFGILLPRGHEYLEIDENNHDKWQNRSWETVISYIYDIPGCLVETINNLTTGFRLNYSETTGSSYWMNHCKHCEMKQDDFEIHNESSGALFFGKEPEDSKLISLCQVNKPFISSCGSCSGSPGWFRTASILEANQFLVSPPQLAVNEDIVKVILSGVFSSADLSTPLYCDYVTSDSSAAELSHKLPLIYIWNENEHLGTFTLSINGSIVGQYVECFMDRVHPDFTKIRDEIISVISEASTESVLKTCQAAGALPSAVFSKEFRAGMIEGMG